MKQLISSFIKKILSPSFWVNLPKNTVIFIKKAAVTLFLFITFFILLIIALIGEIYGILEWIPVVGFPFKKFEVVWNKTLGRYVKKFVLLLDSIKIFEVKRTYLIYLAFENLRSRKSRTAITIAGMSFGVGIIVLLLSLGYGIERLVISRVASLDELNVIDVSTGGNTSIKLNNEAVKKIEGFGNVKQAVSLVSVVGRVTLNKATTDVLVYSTVNEYFPLVNIELKDGVLFKNNDMLSARGFTGDVAGARSELIRANMGDRVNLNTLEFNILPEESPAVWDECTTDSSIMGYTARLEGGFDGQEYWGSGYYSLDSQGQAGVDSKNYDNLGKWVKGIFPLYQRNADDSLRPEFDEVGRHKWVEGCVQKRFIQVENEYALRDVLGEATASASFSEGITESSSSAVLAEEDFADASDSAFLGFDEYVVGTDSAGVEMVDLLSQEKAAKKEVADLEFKGGNSGEAIISSGLLSLLGISEKDALGTTFKSSLIVGKSQIPELDGRALSEEVDYKVVGIIDDPQNQYFYVPFSDTRVLGVTNFSQAKIVLENRNKMPEIRKQIEDLGFRTASTADTVAQIELLFGNLRLVLGLLGMVALGVASLGMFNTLTVSLLERTREIGGMKTIGMVAEEVRDLFLSEAMIMGLSGGIGGLILGFIIGKVLSVLISAFSLANGGEFINLTHIPPFLMLFIIVSSFIVGVFTGLYPAMRARKISALNALRYE